MTEELINKIATINCSDDERKEIYHSLKKHIPMKPSIKDGNKSGLHYECVCGNYVGLGSHMREKYCHRCGQKFNWDDSE